MPFFILVIIGVLAFLYLTGVADDGGPHNKEEKYRCYLAIITIIICVGWPILAYTTRTISHTEIKEVSIVEDSAMVIVNNTPINLNQKFKRNLFTFNKLEVAHYHDYSWGLWLNKDYELEIIEPDMELLQEFLRGIIIPEETELPLEKKIIDYGHDNNQHTKV